jgi:Aspartyl/Asparaginyl beta-hydroxylase
MRAFELLSKGLDVTPLTEALARQPELWLDETTRQDYAGSAHKDTQSIFLRWCKSLDVNAAFTEIPAFDLSAMGKLREAHELINYTIHRAGGLQLGRVLIVSLRSGGVITPHSDEGVYADYYERFHIALKSEDCHFYCGDESVQMKTGELWWFNHKETHQVKNLGTEDRLHLIIDMVAPNFRRERVPHAV